MPIEFGLTAELVNTQFAPVAALADYYEGQEILAPLQLVTPVIAKRDYPLDNQLTQILLSMLTGCQYLSVVNTRLRPERKLAQLYRIDGFANQSTLSRTLDGLTQMNLAQLEASVRQISRPCSRTHQHDWRGFLEMDFDLSGLPCGPQAQGAEKGYFAGKKTAAGVN